MENWELIMWSKFVLGITLMIVSSILFNHFEPQYLSYIGFFLGLALTLRTLLDYGPTFD